MIQVALLGWPFVTLALFAALGPARGLIWATGLGYLFLPEIELFRLPGLPDYDKVLTISLSVLLGAFFFRQRTPPPPLTTMGWLILLFCGACLLFGPVMTVQDNQAPLIDADRVREALRTRDIVSLIAAPAIALVPFFLAFRLLSYRAAPRDILVALTILGAAYSILVLYEWRMSPQLNRLVYDFFPHSWVQHKRGDGFRPIVFLSHGLWLGFFLLSAVLAATALWRSENSTRKPLWLGAAAWLLFVLFLSHNLGATALGVIFLAVLLLTGRSIQTRFAIFCAVAFLAYPALRQADLVPADAVVSSTEIISHARAQSLQTRLDNEMAILDRALEKPLFGWGSWGRWRIIDEKGRDITVSDGIWAIKLGEGGWVGYLGFFGLLAAPLLFLTSSQTGRRPSAETAGLALIMAANLIYMIPNSTLSPIGYMVAGTLAALTLRRAAPASERARTEDSTPTDRLSRSTLSYSRFGSPVDAGRTDVAKTGLAYRRNKPTSHSRLGVTGSAK